MREKLPDFPWDALSPYSEIARQHLIFETNSSVAEVKSAVAAALAGGTALNLQDSRGHEIIVAGDKIGFVDIGVATDRRVGFGAL
jgi:hypothetical protein